MMKRAIKQLLAGLIYYTGLIRLFQQAKNRTNPLPLILMYHCILPREDERRDFLQPGLVVSPELFERQMLFLLSHHRAISLNELSQSVDQTDGSSADEFVVTFDDGWRDNYEFAMPILAKLKIPATVFLSTDFIGTTRPFWFVEAKFIWDKLGREAIIKAIKQLQLSGAHNETELSVLTTDFDQFAEFLKLLGPESVCRLLESLISISPDPLPSRSWVINWDEAKEMIGDGITFGSHGKSHTIFTQLNHERIDEELVESRRKIEVELGRPVDTLAYPNGNCDEKVKQLARDAGYNLALTTGREDDSAAYDEMALPRISVHEGASLGVGGRFSKALFACHLHGVF